jgi:hypothetical protein
VGKIVDAYEKHDAAERQLGSAGGSTGRPNRRKGMQTGQP